MEQLEWERRQLGETMRLIRRELGRIDKRFEEGVQAGDDASEESVRRLLERRWRTLSLVKDNPYFARIDFTERGKDAACPYYLGKTTVMDEQMRVQTLDWRAPAASLYYENRLGKASYACPEGVIEGELSLKRMLTIARGELTQYEDVDIISDDELLKPYLSAKADDRLKSIIATIQAEQNRIIRADLKRNLVVQGVAGSGKTTVALHRIAYFVYTFAEKFRASQFMVLAPSKLFLQYIAPVLPDLGVEDVPQLTFEQLMRAVTGLKKTVEDAVSGLLRRMDEPGTGDERLEYKGSLACKLDLDAFVAGLEEEFRPVQPLVVGGLEALSREEVGWVFDRQPGALPLFRRLASVRRMLETAVRDRPDGKKAVTALMGIKPRPTLQGLYERFCGQGPRKLCWQDLSPLLYLYHRLFGTPNRHVQHIVIDEAQDFSVLGLIALREIYPNATFTLFGDLAQGIYGSLGIGSWQQVVEDVFGSRAEVLTLDKSYRTTVEIMDAAGKVLLGAGLTPGRAVVRHGRPVSYLTAVAPKERLHAVAQAVAECGQHQRVAVIANTPALCAQLARDLKLALVTQKVTHVPDAVCVIPAALSKGLEFDAVILADAESYCAGEEKLLYVAMTRALHSLTVIGLGGFGAAFGDLG